MISASELKEQITSIHAISIHKGFRVEAELKSGERVVIKKKGTKAPKMVQLYSWSRVNGNAWDTVGGYFLFAVSINRDYADKHLKSFPVVIES